MEKYLIAYQISGQTVGIDIQTYDPVDLNGNPAMQIIMATETIPDGYVNISTIENWNQFGLGIANDYAVTKFSIKEICQEIGWTGLTNTEKDLAIIYYSYPDSTTAIIYLMTEKGMSQAEAVRYLTVSWHKHHLQNIVAFRDRWNYAKLTVLTYVSRLDGEDLFNTVKPLIDLYVEVGIIGKDFDDNDDGIYDYIYSINGFVDNGLEENDYTLLQGTWDDFKSDLTDVLIWGNYIKYDNI